MIRKINTYRAVLLAESKPELPISHWKRKPIHQSWQISLLSKWK